MLAPLPASSIDLHFPSSNSTMSLLLLLPLLTVSFIVFKFIHSIFWLPFKIQRHFRQQGIAGPPYRPVFGNTADIQRMYAQVQSKPMSSSPLDSNITPRVMPFYSNWAAQHGKTFLYWFGPKPMLALAEPDMVKDALMNADGAFGRIPFNPHTKLLFGNGILSLEGEDWAFHRRIASRAFGIENVKNWIPKMVDSAAKMIEKWEGIRGGKEEMEIEVDKELTDLSADIISRTAFGTSYQKGKRVFQLQDQQLHLASLAFRSVYIPGFRFLPTKRNQERWRLEKETRDSLLALVRENNQTDQNSRNFLTMLLSAAKDEDGIEKKMGIEEVIEECKTFYFAGKETAAHLLTWVVVLLGAHPEWQDNAREEVFRVCGDAGFPSADNIADFKIINMILNETLRLYPPSVMLKRRTIKDVKLGRLDVPANTQLYLAMTAVHHDVEIWGKDANEFNPGRFSESSRRPVATFFPFGLGPRVCVGQNLAMVEAKVALAMIIKHYSFALSPSYVHAPMQLMTLQPQYGVQIVCRKACGP